MTEKNPKLKDLRQKAMALPLEPGVYLMRNKGRDIIYVGKAKALKNRVSQYFGSDRNHQLKVMQMVLHVEDFDYIVTDSEFEALVLENSLIKQYKPKYNILLKDDKGYSYIRVSSGPWPRITEVKQTAKDGAKYIGPYMSAWSVKQTVDEALKIFLLPTCSRKFPQEFGRGRPCLNYFIKQCCAPCRGKIREEEYTEALNEALEFIRGGSAGSVSQLTEKMNHAAENLDFERAARLRDRIQAVAKIHEKQKVVESTVPFQDVMAVALGEGKAAVTILKFRGGHLRDRQDFLFDDLEDISQLRADFIRQYYDVAEDAEFSREDLQAVPPRLTVDGPVADKELIERWLCQKAGRKVELYQPQKGEQMKLLEMCRSNAAEKLSEGSSRTGKELSALDELSRLLGITAPPEYIEAYDISNLAGGENVGAMVVFENGRPLKSAYRKFKIQTVVGQDDYGSMAEVLSRRFGEYEKLKESKEGFGRMPDLILLDGGKGQVSAVEPMLRSRGYTVPIFGMVKDDKHRTRAVTGSGGEISINSSRRAFTLVSGIQDEVHRFAVGFHRQQRKKSTVSSTLLSIEGIGETRAKALMRHFRTIQSIAEAELYLLESAPGMNKPAARRVYEHFHGKLE